MTTTIDSICAQYADEQGALLAILQAVQQTFGYISRAHAAHVANFLNCSRAEVHGVISFYSELHSEPPARRTVRICAAEACQSMGARRRISEAEQLLGVTLDDGTSGGDTALTAVYCLGNCACAPALMVNDTLYGRVDSDRLQQILAETA